MNALPHQLNRTVVINARPETVFRFFTDSARFASWWGAGSAIDARVGGRVFINYPGNIAVSGEVVEIAEPTRLVFTYGYESGTPFGPGESLVTITLTPHDAGTRLTLAHAFSDVATRDQHVQGWRYQLSLFGNLVSDEVCANATAVADAWFTAWAEPDVTARRETLAAIARESIRFRDRYSMTDGLDDLLPHISASQQFMPGVRLTRAGAVRQCQGTALVEWTATGADGRSLMSGTNVLVFDADGMLVSVTGVAATS